MEREKKWKNKSSGLVANAIPPAYVIYKHCFVITFFFNERSVFLFLGVCVLWHDCNMEVGTVVWELCCHLLAHTSVSAC